MFWTAAFNGYMSSAVHRVWRPSVAPATAYVPMPLGSSSDAPVMKPGPRILPAFLSGLRSFAISEAVPDVAPAGSECGMMPRLRLRSSVIGQFSDCGPLWRRRLASRTLAVRVT